MKSASAAMPAPGTEASNGMIDVEAIRRDFPLLQQQMRGKPLVYLDNAATTPKPVSVIDAVSRFYSEDCSNIHRGLYELSERATRAYEEVREKARRFLNAEDAREIVFVRGTTEGVNLVAQSYGSEVVGAGDEIIISEMEHHSNIVPWQMLCRRQGASLRVVPINDKGELQLDQYARMLGPRTRIVAMAHASNVLGTINPVDEIANMAHKHGAKVLIDGAQAVPHLSVDVRSIGCDFYVFSSHKLFGPTGSGVLYGKRELLAAMPPYQGGGDMISSVTFEKTSYKDVPHKFEAGTPNIAGVIGLGAAIDYVSRLGLNRAAHYEQGLLGYATDSLQRIPGIRIIGTAERKTSIVSFVLDRIHPHDIGTILDQKGIAVRAGHHCAQPLMERFGVPATARASFAFYNTMEEVDALVAGLSKVIEVFSR